jgi:hypothetical protein
MSKKKKTSERIPVDDPPPNSAAKAPSGEPVAAAAPAPAPSPKKEKPAPPKVKLNYVDPGAERKLPAPPRISVAPGDRVRLKKAQEYADATVPAGSEGFALNPSSQAACWCVSFLTPGGPVRVVPEWLLEPAGSASSSH